MLDGFLASSSVFYVAAIYWSWALFSDKDFPYDKKFSQSGCIREFLDSIVWENISVYSSTSDQDPSLSELFPDKFAFILYEVTII